MPGVKKPLASNKWLFLWGTRLTWGVRWAWQKVREVIYGLQECALADEHHDVDGVEVALAQEATGEVRSAVGCGADFLANRAQEADEAFGVFGRNLQRTDDQ